MTALTRNELRKLVGEWMAAGKICAGPVRVRPGTVLFTRLASPDDLLLDGWVRPANSIKELVLPRHEVLYGYRVEKHSIELVDQPEALPEQMVIGAHPCDAAALPILDKVFNWDFRDEAYNRRRAATTVITLACAERDEECFCTSVGLGPEAERGSDAMLFEQGDGSFAVRSLTDKGRAALGEGTASGGQTDPAPVRFDSKQVASFAAEHFADPFWQAQALACVGCGACAYTCPVCHCFDIVDEGNGREGVRARNWDACQFPLFTLHASGHNPRHGQGDRQRQRIYHKFLVYPEKFGEILCTGCGNCARNCPVGLGVLPLVSEIPHAEPV
jgi:ferredoxin